MTLCDRYLHLLQEENFNWLKQWYPLAAVEDLNPDKPFATKLLGECIRPVLICWWHQPSVWSSL